MEKIHHDMNSSVDKMQHRHFPELTDLRLSLKVKKKGKVIPQALRLRKP